MIPIETNKIDFPKIKNQFLNMINSILVDNRSGKKKQKAQLLEIYRDVNKKLDSLNITERIDQIFVAEFDTLKKIKKMLDVNKCIYKAYDGKDKPGYYVKNSSFNIIYKAFDKINNNWLIKELGITVCPYCNRDFINNRGNSTAAQVDHFYPRSKYPLFAVSIYNLIPSCYACNHIKFNNIIDVSPYDKNFSFNDSLKFSYIPLSYDYIYDLSQIKIKIKCKNEISKNVKIMKIDKAYEVHADYVQELIIKSKIYNKTQIKEYLTAYPNLFMSREDVLRTVYGNYIKENELGKRPLAKLTKDILDEIGVEL